MTLNAVSFDELEQRVLPEKGRRPPMALQGMTVHARNSVRQGLLGQVLRSLLAGALVTCGSFLAVVLSTGASARRRSSLGAQRAALPRPSLTVLAVGVANHLGQVRRDSRARQLHFVSSHAHTSRHTGRRQGRCLALSAARCVTFDNGGIKLLLLPTLAGNRVHTTLSHSHTIASLSSCFKAWVLLARLAW